jgi:hypothetical protein
MVLQGCKLEAASHVDKLFYTRKLIVIHGEEVNNSVILVLLKSMVLFVFRSCLQNPLQSP